MPRYLVILKDRQTGKQTTVKIEAQNLQEAKKIAMKDYGVAYEIKGVG